MGGDVRDAAGQHQPVEPVDQVGAVEERPERRDQQRQGAGRLDQRRDILVADDVERQPVDILGAGRHADQRRVGIELHSEPSPTMARPALTIGGARGCPAAGA